MEEEHFYNNIQKALEEIHGEFNILEEQIDIDVQMKYFEFVDKIRKNSDTEWFFENRDKLFLPEINDDEKKEIIAGLGIVDDVKAFRTLEKFVKETEGEINQWAILALNESRMLMHSSLLDEQQVFISTGLGGKGKNLRYFVVFLNQNQNESLNETQQKLLKNELIFELKKWEGQFESMDCMDGFNSALVLLPISADIKNVFNSVVDECNQFGNFLQEDIIITNMKVLSRSEIIQMLHKNKNQDFDELEEE